MKNLGLLLAFFIILFTNSAFADQHVSGYYRNNGTYVQPYTRSSPDNTVTNNYSYKGNSNPYTGQLGTNSYEHDSSSPHYQGPDSRGQIGHGSSNNYNGTGYNGLGNGLSSYDD